MDNAALAAHIKKVLDEAPPITEEVSRLFETLCP